VGDIVVRIRRRRGQRFVRTSMERVSSCLGMSHQGSRVGVTVDLMYVM